ncbi:MAG: HAD-IIIC family phosphatase [Pseudanabaenales cyanobacterium]|nr:HAD-IIIC family phosphatase [Pseudanabaenales cyanobacterium]
MMPIPTESINTHQTDRTVIKCVVWDLDNTLWHGVLLEDEQVRLRPQVADIIRTLDSRGILQSLASRNESTVALAKLREWGLAEYFLYPQINWNSKVASIQTIAQSLNIGFDTIAFIDDQPFELAEVRFSLSDVLCINAAELNHLLDLPVMQPRFITSDSRQRRLMYLSDIQRKQAETEFVGPQTEFLATLNMTFTIAIAQEEDLQRAEELTIRTNQLNTTGDTYSYDQLNQLRQSKQHKLLIASLEDKFGGYGKIGLALVNCRSERWLIKLLLMSCRVMARGVGTILLNYIMQLARENQVRLMSEFVVNDRNRMMYITYKFAGFREVETHNGRSILAADLSQIQPFPDYVKVKITA